MDSDVIREGDLVLTPGEFGRVVGDASGPMVVVDHNGRHAVYPLHEVEAVVGVSERDAAIAERDALQRVLEQKDDALIFKRLVGCELRLDAVIAERDRLRAEVQKLRDHVRRLDPGAFVLASDVAEMLGDMLEES